MVVSLATVLTRPDSVFNTGPELLAVLCIFLSSVFRWRCFSAFFNFPQESISDAKLMLFKCFHRSNFLFLLPHQLFPRVWSVTPSEPPRDGSVEKNARCVNSLPFPLSVRGFFFILSFFVSLCAFACNGNRQQSTQTHLEPIFFPERYRIVDCVTAPQLPGCLLSACQLLSSASVTSHCTSRHCLRLRFSKSAAVKNCLASAYDQGITTGRRLKVKATFTIENELL